MPAEPLSPNPPLLCEQCGYALTSTPPTANCPECGDAVVNSLPSRRIGTPWQQARTWRAFFHTMNAVHFSPSQLFRVMATSTRDRTWMFIHLAIAAIIGATIVTITRAAASSPPSPYWQRLFLALIPLFALLLMLTELERLGMYWIARRRGWRVDRTLTLAICSHASCVWWAATVGMGIGVTLAKASSYRRIDFGIEFIPPIPTPLLFGILGVMPGLLWFETLAFIGLRMCCYANLQQNLHKTVRSRNKNAPAPSA